MTIRVRPQILVNPNNRFQYPHSSSIPSLLPYPTNVSILQPFSLPTIVLSLHHHFQSPNQFPSQHRQVALSPQPSGCLQVSTACRWPAKPRHTAVCTAAPPWQRGSTHNTGQTFVCPGLLPQLFLHALAKGCLLHFQRRFIYI